jgi:exonuclease SbcD
MKKVLLAGNLRLSPHFYFLKGTSLQQKRQEDFSKNFSLLVDKAIDEKVKLMLVAGNFFDTFLPEPLVLSSLDENLRKLERAGIVLVLNGGPRDLSRDDTTFSCNYFKGKTNVVYFSNPEWEVKEIEGFKILGKRYSHVNRGTVCLDLKDKVDFILLNENTTEEIENLSKNSSAWVVFPATFYKQDKNFIYLPGIENISFEEYEKYPKKGGVVWQKDKQGKAKIDFFQVPVREMITRKIKFSLKDESILQKIKRVVKEKSPEKIAKVTLQGAVLFDVYKSYNREEIFRHLSKRYFYVLVENELQVEELIGGDISNIKILPPAEEFAVLLDEMIKKYQKSGNKEYEDFYIRVKKIGLSYLEKV